MSHCVFSSRPIALRRMARSVEGAFGSDVEYAMLVKLYGNNSFASNV